DQQPDLSGSRHPYRSPGGRAGGRPDPPGQRPHPGGHRRPRQHRRHLTMGWVADYSFARPDLAALKQAGCEGICRYATGPGKQVEAQESDAALHLGMGVVIVQEGGNQPALRGYPGGVADARTANSRLDMLGNYPDDCWIYYVAEDPTRLVPSAWPTVVAYFHG